MVVFILKKLDCSSKLPKAPKKIWNCCTKPFKSYNNLYTHITKFI